MTTLKKLLAGTGVVFASMLAATTISFAQEDCGGDYPPPPGVPTHCIVVNGEKVWVDINGDPVPGTSEGGATFVAQENREECSSEQAPESFDITVRSEFGEIRTTLDPERQSPNSTIVPNNPDEGAFPATATIQVYLRAESDAFGELQSRNLVTLVNPYVKEFPFQEAEFQLVEKVEFVKAGDLEGEAILTLTETRIILSSERQ